MKRIAILCLFLVGAMLIGCKAPNHKYQSKGKALSFKKSSLIKKAHGSYVVDNKGLAIATLFSNDNTAEGKHFYKLSTTDKLKLEDGKVLFCILIEDEKLLSSAFLEKDTIFVVNGCTEEKSEVELICEIGNKITDAKLLKATVWP